MVYYFTRDNKVWIRGDTNNMSMKGTTAITVIITFHQSVQVLTFFTCNLSFITPEGDKRKLEAS